MMEFAKEVIGPTSFHATLNMSDRQKTLREIFPVCFIFIIYKIINILQIFSIFFFCLIKGAIGALDGTLVHAVVPATQQTAYRGRGGGRCYQNVLGIYDFNMIFTFVWAG